MSKKPIPILNVLLVFYLKEKSRIVEELTGIALVNEKDIKEVCTWSEEMIHKFFRGLDVVISGSDKDICPWCTHFYGDGKRLCITCCYGRRHGNCIEHLYGNPFTDIGLNYESDYGKIINKLQGNHHNSISNIERIKDLVKDVQSVYENIVSGNGEKIIKKFA